LANFAHGSWAGAIEDASILVELDLAGSNPSYFDRFGPALWPQCEQIDVHIWVDPTIEPALRASARSLTVNTILALNELTGLQFLVRSGSSEQDEQFFDAAIVPAVPGIRELGLYWYNTASDQPSAQFGLADIWHSNPVELDRVLSDGSVSVTAKDTPTKQASLLRTRVGLSIGILRELPDTHITEPSQAMAVLHELAHVVGVGHSTDRESFMYPRFNDDTRLTTPDRATLAPAGSNPCRPGPYAALRPTPRCMPRPGRLPAAVLDSRPDRSRMGAWRPSASLRVVVIVRG
jgi:hypothetical protein